MKRYLPFVIIAVVALLAVASGFFLTRTKQRQLNVVAVAPDGTAAKAGAKPPHVRGGGSEVTIEEFGDYQCPPCGAMSGVLRKLETEFHDQLNVVFRNYPLPMHQHAMAAAQAAEAAGLQGKFWEMHDLLYENQTGWSGATDLRPVIESYVSTLGLNATRFWKDYESPQVRARIAADQARAASLGVNQTPSVFLNGKPLPSSVFPLPEMQKQVRAALENKPAG